MPTIILQTSVKCTEEQKHTLAKELSKICAAQLNKPEMYVMSIINDDATVYFGGSAKRAAMLDVSSVGNLGPNINTAFSKAICEFLSKNINIDPSNIYINFTDVKGANWGWNSKTFA